MAAIRPFNSPIPIALDEYRRAIDAYVERAVEISGIRSVYTMGSIKAPGLSDIDLIVVVDDSFDGSLSAGLSTAGIDDRLFVHGAVVVPVSMAPAFQYIIYASGLERLHGDDSLPEFEQTESAHIRSLRIAYVIDFLESRQAQYCRVFEKGSVDQRAWMARLWSLTHSEQLLRDAGADIADADAMVLARIRQLRADWLESNSIDDSEFDDVFRSSVGTSRSLWRTALDLGYRLETKSRPVMRLRCDNKFFEFRSDVQTCSASSWTFRLPGRRVSMQKLAANTIYAAHLAAYGYMDASAVSATTELNADCLLQRARAVRLHQQWVAERCPRAGSMTGYTGVAPTVPGRTRRYATNLVKVIGRYGEMLS